MVDRSLFQNLVAYFISLKGDLSNITCPPSFLAAESIVQTTSCYADRPSLFVAAAKQKNPADRCLAVLKWFLASHRRQFYIGQDAEKGIRKPLNAFLGEIFQGTWTDDVATVHSVTEQVSRNPAVTACYISAPEHKVWGEGYCRTKMKFTGTFHVEQIGHAILHLDNLDEHYLLQLPNINVQGFFSGCLWPELYGTCHIVCNSGYAAEIVYSPKDSINEARNTVHAKVYHMEQGEDKPVYILKGCWNDAFSVYDVETGVECDHWSHSSHTPSKHQPSAPIALQDPWETENAWSTVVSALQSGDLVGAMLEKGKIEDAQNFIQNIYPQYEDNWTPLFFRKYKEHSSLLEEQQAGYDEEDGEEDCSEDGASRKYDEVFANLAKMIPDWDLRSQETKGVWRYSEDAARNATRPYHNGLTPTSRPGRGGPAGHPCLVFDNGSKSFKPLGLTYESELPQEQIEYLRARRTRKRAMNEVKA